MIHQPSDRRRRTSLRIAPLAVPSLVLLLCELLPMGPQPLAQCPPDTLATCSLEVISTAPSDSVSGCVFNSAGAGYDLLFGQLSVGAPAPATDAVAKTGDLFSIVGPSSGSPIACSATLSVSGGYAWNGTVTIQVRAGGTVKSTMHGPYGVYGTTFHDDVTIPLAMSVGSPFLVSLGLHANSPGATGGGTPSSAWARGNLIFSLPPGYSVTSCQGFASGPTRIPAASWGTLRVRYR